MKKALLGTMLFLAITACNKESETTENTEVISSDSVVTIPEDFHNEPAVPFREVELSAGETSELLAKKNDTLYVTNFFATWCGPCVREIPHFREKIKETENQPVKITFVALDVKEDWTSKVKPFVEEHRIAGNTVLVNPELLTPEFFPENFQKWDGGSIPFTFMRKGEQTDETIGMMSKEMLDSKMASFSN